jgi:hypothetical protein
LQAAVLVGAAFSRVARGAVSQAWALWREWIRSSASAALQRNTRLEINTLKVGG